MLTQEYFKQFNNYEIAQQIILNVLRDQQIHIGYGGDECGDYSYISGGEIDNNQTQPMLSCYREDIYCLRILFYNEQLEKYDVFKENIEKEHLVMIPEGLHEAMVKVLRTGDGISISAKELN